MTEQVLDVKEALRLIRRYWRVVLAFLVVGVVAATAYVVVTVPRYEATSLVLLPVPTAGSGTSAPARGVTTDTRVATSAAVLVPAGRVADPSLSLSTLQHRVSATSTATSVLKIAATGPTRQQAEALANAVATQLVTFVTTSGATASVNVVAGLRSEVKQLSGQIANVQGELTAANSRVAADGRTSAAGQQDARLVSGLSSQESSLILQLNSVKSQISQAQLQVIATDQGSQVIQRATTATPPSKSTLVLPVVLGAIGGLLLGSVVVLARFRRDPRLRSRDAIADAVGAPVLLSLQVPARRSPSDWVALFERHQPSALELWSIRRVLRELGTGDGAGGALSIMALADDGPAVAQAAHVALAAAASGLRTSFGVPAGAELAPALRAACARLAAAPDGARPLLRVVEDGPGSNDDEDDAWDLQVATVLVGTPPASEAADHLAPTTVLSVSAGFASADRLAAVAICAADGGVPIRGVFVANPVADDHTVGRRVDATTEPAAVVYRRAGGTRPLLAAGRTR